MKSLPERMRQAADTVEEATKSLWGFAMPRAWSSHDLRHWADRFQLEEDERAEKAARIQELADYLKAEGGWTYEESAEALIKKYNITPK